MSFRRTGRTLSSNSRRRYQPSISKTEQQGFLNNVKKSVYENPWTFLRSVVGAGLAFYIFSVQQRLVKEEADDYEKLAIVSLNKTLFEQGIFFLSQIHRPIPVNVPTIESIAKKSTVFVLHFTGDMTASQVTASTFVQ